MIFARQREWSKIVHLFPEQVNKLFSLGYSKNQIESILVDMLQWKQKNHLSSEDIVRIQGELEQFIEFARNCYQSMTCK